MSQQFREGRLRFEFPDEWKICRPEKCSYYLRHFQTFAGGSKEMDFLAYDPRDSTLWLIEVKDYARSGREKELPVEVEVALKVRDVLAMLAAGASRDGSASSGETIAVGEFWQFVRNVQTIRVVLHCELPYTPSRLFAPQIDAANIRQLLRGALRAVNPHAVVTDQNGTSDLGWAVAVEARQ